MDAFGLYGPGIRHVKNMKGFVIHISGGRLYGVTITCQQEYGEDDAWMYGLNPSEHRPSQTLRGSLAKDSCFRSKCFQASPLDG